MARKSERLNLRVTPEQDTLLRHAAEARGESVTEYVLRHAVEAAETELADRRVFFADEASWERLQELLARPPRPADRLRKLLAEPSVLER